MWAILATTASWLGIAIFHRIEQRAAGLLFYIGGAAIPKLAAQECGIECGGRVAAAKQAFIALAGGHVVHAVAGQVVARVAAYGVAAREARLIPQLLAELDLAFGERLRGINFGACRQGTENALCFGEQIFIFGAGAAVVILLCRCLRGSRGGLRGGGLLGRFVLAGIQGYKEKPA